MTTIIRGDKRQETSEPKTLELHVDQPASSVRGHCMAGTRATVTIDAPLGPLTYARMFPELPSFRADEEFLHALGRVGGVCDCGNNDDLPESLADTAAGWPFLANL